MALADAAAVSVRAAAEAAGTVKYAGQAVPGQPDFRVKVIEPHQLLGEIDEELRLALGLDVVGVHGPGTMFGFKNENWVRQFAQRARVQHEHTDAGIYMTLPGSAFGDVALVPAP